MPKNDPSSTDDADLASFLRCEAEVRKHKDDGIWELLIEAAESIERLAANLEGRDKFIGERGLFDAFVQQLPKSA